ncbi:efflux RND transporter permease subunit [Algoriphagus zhangzhouensis]|uniref:Hydrophobic/amphiphilic exporter-1, HAE1 family n=1 Tax=Algoriphagus zhangzhouensis TaxID=1073327 RepID=A0A1M7Z5L3_9BACT|nr:efflux RND transporter permease subunit [Algoriphagus zhangzhouensis]TDY48973.1 HAE1 family hydrophobic/amphiphilic exporter-1 [Algoriphagus zhangzhouensis]SHO60237.1 hydrophobic/amphiphilic exporter-1, HAE1 family [Algoriphagus zhangzhouensis]
MFELFIRRPILSTVISVFITLLGILALTSLPITQFPDIVPPSVTVTAKYTGANAEVLAKAVATPLERAINGVPGMEYMYSVNTNEGITLITIIFQVGTDPDQAAVNVQNRVATVVDELPEEVIRAGVMTEKEVNSMLLYLNLITSDPAQDEKFVYNFADINILPELKRIDGVGFAEIMGMKDYAMRVWLKPDRLAAYDISPQDVTDAIQNQNVEAAPGKSGISSDRDPQALQYVLKYTGKFNQESEFENITLKALPDGSLLKLKDVADIEFDALDYNMMSMTDGRPSASIMLKQRPGSNASEVIENIKIKMEELEGTSFPPGMSYNVSYDVSRFLDASIHEVIKTLIEAFILVFIVVFLFLQDFRSTLIPAIAVPVSLVGTLFFMQMFGFSINLLTLFALVLAIGIVVDNAIVVVEAVHVKMHDLHLNAFDATIEAMKEIGGAIVAITLVMSAVFIPVSFLSGPVGIFYRQFSLTLAIAIVISGINALTLSPALCAMMLKPMSHDPNKKKGAMQRFFDGFNAKYDALAGKYTNIISGTAGRRAVTFGALFIFFALTYGMISIVPTGFIPNEDQGMIYVNVTTPPGATVDRTTEIMDQVQAALLPLDEVETVSTLAGYSLLTETAGASYGMGMINLKSWDQREMSVNELILDYSERTSHIKGADIQFFAPPPVPGFGNASGFEMRLQDKSGGDLDNMALVTEEFVQALNDRPELDAVFTNFDPTFPQFMISVDHDKAAKLGVSVQDAMATLQSYIGSFYASNFIRYGQMYKVMIQASPEYRTSPESLLTMFAKNKDGEMVPYSNFVSLERVYGPEQLTRYNMFSSAMVSGEAAEGYSSGDAIKAVEEVALQTLPRGFSIDWSGITREQIASGNQAVYIFLICLVFVYLLLAAQYESYMLPLSVILSLPAGIFGSYFFLNLVGLQNDIYAQVSLVMLIGLLGKNAILIIEIAIQNRNKGLGILESAIKGGVERLRPILMTSFAFICGLIPLTIASGAGAIGNRTIGTAAAGGMFIGTLIGVFLIPGLYVVFETIDTKMRAKKAQRQNTVKQEPVLEL